MPSSLSKSVAILFLGITAFLLQQPLIHAARTQLQASGREALAAVRHDWKKDALGTIHAKKAATLPIPAHFGQLSPEARLAFLHERRNLDSTRFDANHPHIGPLLAADDRLRAAESQGIQTMNGLLPDNALTRYLDYRRSLNPARFDHYHPTLGAILVEDQKLKHGAGAVAPEIIPPQTVSNPPNGAPASGPPVGGGPLPTRSVPEPTSLILVLLGSTVALGRLGFSSWKKRSKSRGMMSDGIAG